MHVGTVLGGVVNLHADPYVAIVDPPQQMIWRRRTIATEFQSRF